MTDTYLTQWADVVDPRQARLGSVALDDLTRHFGLPWVEGVSKRLRTTAQLLRAPEATIVFGGHFSSGKSTLINALTRRELLPTSDYPETGVPCWIRRGDEDRAQAVTRSRRRQLSLNTDAIAREVSLVDSTGDYRTEVHELEQLFLELAGTAVPREGACWGDSPGINDTPEMTKRAAVAAHRSDILVWVVNSKQPLSEVEQAFLSDHVVRRGVGGLILVVNAFLEQDTPAEWERFLAGRADFHRLRAEQALAWEAEQAPEARPAVLFMSARAALWQPDGFGADQVRDVLGALTPGHPMVRAARLARAAAAIGDLRQDVVDLLQKKRDSLAAARRAHAEACRVAEGQRRAFEGTLAAEVTSAFSRHRAAADACTTAVVAELDGLLQRDGALGRSLTAKLTAVSQALASELWQVTSWCAQKYGIKAPTQRAYQELSAALAPRPISVVVPYNPVVRKSNAGAGATIGRIIDTLFSPRVATAIGTAIENALGAGASDDGPWASIARDRAQAKVNARTAGYTATAELMGKNGSALNLLRGACVADTPSRTPDARPVKMLESLHEWLTSQYTALSAQAATAASGKGCGMTGTIGMNLQHDRSVLMLREGEGHGQPHPVGDRRRWAIPNACSGSAWGSAAVDEAVSAAVSAGQRSGQAEP